MKKFGCYVITSEFGVEEFPTFTCGHCNRPKVIKHKERPEDVGGTCSICWLMICPTCVQHGRCDPFEEKLKRVEDRARTRQSYGM